MNLLKLDKEVRRRALKSRRERVRIIRMLLKNASIAIGFDLHKRGLKEEDVFDHACHVGTQFSHLVRVANEEFNIKEKGE